MKQSVFEGLCHALCNTPILSYPDFSCESVGCVLAQMNDENMENVIAYGSRKLTKTETRWPTYDRELWAIVWAIRHFRQYLTGYPFCIIIDHKPLLSLRTMALDCDPTEHRARWALEIDPYDWTMNIDKAQNMQMLTPCLIVRRQTNQVGCVSSHMQTDPVKPSTCASATGRVIYPEATPTFSVTTNVTSPVQSATPHIAVVTMDPKHANADSMSRRPETDQSGGMCFKSHANRPSQAIYMRLGHRAGNLPGGYPHFFQSLRM